MHRSLQAELQKWISFVLFEANTAKQTLARLTELILKACIQVLETHQLAVLLGFPGFLDIGDIAAAADRLVPARLFLQDYLSRLHVLSHAQCGGSHSGHPHTKVYERGRGGEINSTLARATSAFGSEPIWRLLSSCKLFRRKAAIVA